jgi:hypothetical protein
MTIADVCGLLVIGLPMIVVIWGGIFYLLKELYSDD